MLEEGDEEDSIEETTAFSIVFGGRRFNLIQSEVLIFRFIFINRCFVSIIEGPDQQQRERPQQETTKYTHRNEQRAYLRVGGIDTLLCLIGSVSYGIHQQNILPRQVSVVPEDWYRYIPACPTDSAGDTGNRCIRCGWPACIPGNLAVGLNFATHVAFPSTAPVAYTKSRATTLRAGAATTALPCAARVELLHCSSRLH